MRGLLADWRHALRLYMRTPGSSLFALAVLAIGMACVTALVSLYADLALKPYPGLEGSRHVVTFGQGSDARVNPGLIERVATESVTLAAAAGTLALEFRAGRDAQPAVGEVVTGQYFDGLRPRLALGRGLQAEDHSADAEPVVVISWRYWRRMLGGRDDVIGTMLSIQDQRVDGGTEWPEFRIVGVAAREFRGIVPLSLGEEVDVWLPLEQWLALPGSEFGVFSRTLASLSSMLGVARRAPGASNAAIVRELNGRFPDYFELPDFISPSVVWPGATDPANLRFMVMDGIVSSPSVHRSMQRQLRIMLAASVLLATVAAANVSLFLLARAPGRQRELGIRMAVGAPLRRLARQLASEAAVLVVLAALIGLGLSVWLAGYLGGLEFLGRAQWINVTPLDWRVLMIVGAFLAALTLLVSLAPILGLRRLGIAGSSRQVSARAGIAQRIAGNLQIAIAGTLGGAALAFALYLGSVIFGHPGYETRDLHVVSLVIDRDQYFVQSDTGGRTLDRELVLVDQARRREAIESLPGVTGVSFAGAVPGMPRGIFTDNMPAPDGANDPTAVVSVEMMIIDHNYVDLLGLTLLHGRTPEPNEPAILVNQALARLAWGREDVVGEHLPVSQVPDAGRVVAGVLADLPYAHPAAEASPRGFVTTTAMRSTFGPSTALVRTAHSSSRLRSLLQGLVDSGVLELEIADVRPLAALRHDAIAEDRARGLLTIAAATLVVLLAAFGFYGTQRYLVEAGRREMAIRASLGAGPSALGRLVIRRGLLLGLPGVLLGGLLAFLVVAWLRDDYVPRDVSPSTVTVLVVGGLAALLLLASLAPARSARRVQPAALLRED